MSAEVAAQPLTRNGSKPAGVNSFEVDRVIALQIEYQKKIHMIAERHEKLNEEILSVPTTRDTETIKKSNNLTKKKSAYVLHTRPILSAAEQLARYASGLIESSKLSKIDKLELQLRNAELEAELLDVKRQMI